MKVVNLTPHAIVLVREYWDENDFTNGDNHYVTERVTYQPSGIVCRVDISTTTTTGDINGFPVVMNTVTGINGLPSPVEGVRYLVSAMVLDSAKFLGRTDCIAPDTNRATRNDKGHIISVPGFVA